MTTATIVFTTAFISGVSLIVYMWYEAHRNTLHEHELDLVQFPESFDGLRVFFISDIHTRSIDMELLNQIQQPVDIVIIGGDLMEKGVSFERVGKNLERLTQIAPTYFVWGNNDYEVDYRRLDVLLREKGVHILDNTCAKFETDEDVLYLMGVDDPTLDKDRLDLALQDVDEKGYKLLASHNPLIAEKIEQDHQIGIVLSGHTHGGQIRFFKWGVAERGGLKDTGLTKVFVSNGYGYTKLPFRLCAPSEAHIFTFTSKTD
ncbi:metallophosphoesterase [Alkalihalobacillus sp. AL-G]|uniref:metallophosphoesterase n=1 Tax=Alkalihalobacillus sp. AL-G TaxID=2926399 RepID=UPI00272D7C21|nr:metallophosphoesterase [Alkalihalobacillus sp. AL-G]WLD91855.1 metallophosphoesterase [Alkalihalobacillus sp. AL-G]